MFHNKEKDFIKKQSWFNDYVSSGTKTIKNDLIHCINKNDKSRAYTDSINLGITQTGTILLYARILEKLETFGRFDNCSLLLIEENT